MHRMHFQICNSLCLLYWFRYAYLLDQHKITSVHFFLSISLFLFMPYIAEIDLATKKLIFSSKIYFFISQNNKFVWIQSSPSMRRRSLNGPNRNCQMKHYQLWLHCPSYGDGVWVVFEASSSIIFLLPVHSNKFEFYWVVIIYWKKNLIMLKCYFLNWPHRVLFCR